MTKDIAIIPRPDQSAIGGGLEGATNTSRETARWTPSMLSPDQVINGVKQMADARSRDMMQNDGYVTGAANLHKDNIVGAQYRLNAKPNWRMLGLEDSVGEAWAEEFQVVVENRFNTLGDSEAAWFDAAGRLRFTDIIRLAIGGFVVTGEVLATAEWLRDLRRPFKTAIQMISPDRLSNEGNAPDDQFWRRGVRKDFYGRPTQYSIRAAHPGELFNIDSYRWKIINAEKPWGRKQVIHIIDQLLPDQTRGIADMVAALKQMKMTKHFQEITLQNAVINASYAAAIESELPTAEALAAIGGGAPLTDSMGNYINAYLGLLATYLDGSKNIQIDGAKIPHLFPGTKLNMLPIGTPGGVGTDFEQSLLRHTASALGLSYEEFARDFTKTNYSSARASMNNTWKFMQSRKKSVADRLANNIYALFLEEDLALGNVPLPPGKTRDWFYEPGVKDAICEATWIGASRGQIDETKETEAALNRIEGGISTYEDECARLGKDFREVFAQRAREEKLKQKLSLTFTRNGSNPNASSDGNPDATPAQDAPADSKPNSGKRKKG